MLRPIEGERYRDQCYRVSTADHNQSRWRPVRIGQMSPCLGRV